MTVVSSRGKAYDVATDDADRTVRVSVLLWKFELEESKTSQQVECGGVVGRRFTVLS